MLETMPNEQPGLRLHACHKLPLPSCCPVSKNPQPGSKIAISYWVEKTVLEVYALKRYLLSFQGGHPSGVRTMEGMIQQITQDCAEALGVPVTVHALVILQGEGESLEFVCSSAATPRTSMENPAT